MLFRNDHPEDIYLERAARGEQAALEFLVNRYRNMAYTVAVRITGNTEDAEEVVQDSFLKAFKHLHDFRRAAKFSTWLYRIVYHMAINKRKARSDVHEPLDSQVDMEDALHGTNTSWHHMINADRRKFVSLAIASLNEDVQIIITLHYIAEKSISEISEITGLGRSAIKMRLLRGRDELKNQLTKLLNKEISEL